MNAIYSFAADGFEVKIKYLTFNDTVRWQNNSQKLIRLDSNRPDSTWDWRKIYGFGIASTLIGQKTKGYVATIDNVQIGIMSAAFHYNCHKEDEIVPSFLWYISKSPLLNEIIDVIEFETGTRPKIPFGDIMYKVMLSEIEKHNSDTKPFWLHADPKAYNPKKLLQYYIKKGFLSCPLARTVTFRNDDKRYLYYPLSQAGIIKKATVEYDKN